MSHKAIAKSRNLNPLLRLYGSWYLYDEKDPNKISSQPIFQLLPTNQFVDSIQILCHLDKFQQADILQVISNLLSSEKSLKLKDCPIYTFEQEGSQIRIKNNQSADSEPKYVLDFLDLKSEIEFGKNRKGKWIILYVEIKTRPGVDGIMIMQPDSIRARRISMVLIE